MILLRSPSPGRWLPFAFVLIAGGYPLLRLLLVPFVPGLAPPQLAVGGDRSLSMAAIGNSVRIGTEAGLVALIPGFAIGYALERFDWAGGRLLGGALWLLLLTPSFLLCAGWQLFVGLPLLAATPLYNMLFSEAGIVALLMLKGLPFAGFTARAAWAAIGGEVGAAARIHVRDRWRRAAILARMLAPAVGAVFAVAFIEGIADFGIAATLGAHLHMPLVIYGIYAALARTPIDFIRAAQLSLVLIVLAAFAVALHQGLLAHGGGRASHGRPTPARRPGRVGGVAVVLATAVLILCAFVVPMLGLATRALAVHEPMKLRADEWMSLAYSACYAFVAATLSVALALALIGRQARAGTSFTRLVDFATMGSMAVPGIVLGAAYVIAFNGWLPLYGTPLLLLLGLVATHLPILVRFLQTPLSGLHSGLADAAALHGIRLRDRVELIHAPLLLRPLLWGWALAFGGLFFELPLASLLYPIGRAPIGVQLLALDETLRFADEARLALAGIVTCMGIVALMVFVLPWWLARRIPSKFADAGIMPS